MLGRPRKPTRIKELEGNPGKRPLNKFEPQFEIPAGLPAPPDFLDEDGLREWARAGKLLIEAKVLTEGDLSALAAYCAIYSRWAEAERKVRRMGSVVNLSKDKEKPFPALNPWLSVANTCLKQMRAYLAELGLTPSSRSKIIAGEGPKPIDHAEKQKADKYFM